MALMPLFLGVLILGIISYNKMSSETEDLMYQKLELGAAEVAEHFGGRYTAMNEGLGLSLEGTADEWASAPSFSQEDLDFIDSGKVQNVEYTLFKGNKRFLTSLLDSSTGKRVYGTEANADIYASVSKGETYFGQNVKINGKDYMVCYKPLYNEDGDGKIVGLAFSGESMDNIKAAKRSLLVLIVAVAVVLMVVFAVFAVLLSKVIANPLRQTAEAAEALSEGYINRKMDVKANVMETMMLADAMQKLQENLQTIVLNIRNTSTELSGSVKNTDGLCQNSAEGASQISNAVDELATTAMSMAESVQSLNSNMIEIGDGIEGISAAVETLNESARNMDSISNDAAQDINDVYASSEKSVNAVVDIYSHMNELANAIQEISEATTIISGISSQTNLLSLNASIEAARAGEAGKGFAVVAGEISSLATQSDDGAKKIDEITRRVLNLSNKSKELTEDIKNIIDEEQKKVQKTQESFMKLKENIETSIYQIEVISNDTEKLSASKASAMSSVTDLSAISEENAASNEEVTASVSGLSDNIKDIASGTDTMSSMADTLADAISAFKDDEE